MYAWWYSEGNNFGDAINPVLIGWISGEEPKNYRTLSKKQKQEIQGQKNPIYVVCGSVIQWTPKNSVVWGAGFISKDAELKEKPIKVKAVRGSLTRKKLLNQGINCPEIYGDPVLLLPKFYNPDIEKRYELGIIPHYVDYKNDFTDKIKDNKYILVIDIADDWREVVREVLSCKKIASSSLHGLIVADAYNIPSLWIKFDREVKRREDVVKGEGFKFRDYFKSVGREDKGPLLIDKGTVLEDIYDGFYNYQIDINLDKLLESCPFSSS